MDALLQCRNLSKHFGAVAAVTHVDLAVARGTLHSVIGPNGAGKTTLFNCITGELAPTQGEVVFEERVISGLPSHRLLGLGIARSFQRTSIFSTLTVGENVWMAAYARRRTDPLAYAKPADSDPSLHEVVQDALGEVGLERYADRIAGELAHGDQRLLDFAIAVAADPTLLLLDEPTAGLSQQETRRVLNHVNRLKGRYTIVLIEHKMDVVMELSDRISVMYFGSLLTEGTPEEVRRDPKVREAYLGKRG